MNELIFPFFKRSNIKQLWTVFNKATLQLLDPENRHFERARENVVNFLKPLNIMNILKIPLVPNKFKLFDF